MELRWLERCWTVFAIAAVSSAVANAEVIQLPELPDEEPATLTPLARLAEPANYENSGFVKSRQHEDVYWALNDSGNMPRVYAVKRDGTLYGEDRPIAERGVLVEGAVNRDWEDIAVDGEGHLVIADFGNNYNYRRDLTLYVVAEPNPQDETVEVKTTYQFHYPEQTEFPAPRDDFNYDAEALFHARGHFYVVTKHRSDRNCRLYRLDDLKAGENVPAKLIHTIELGGQVTGAGATDDGERIAFATYTGLWVFESEDGGEDWFKGAVYWYPFRLPQMETVTFDTRDSLLFTDERLGAIFSVNLTEMTRVR